VAKHWHSGRRVRACFTVHLDMRTIPTSCRYRALESSLMSLGTKAVIPLSARKRTLRRKASKSIPEPSGVNGVVSTTTTVLKHSGSLIRSIAFTFLLKSCATMQTPRHLAYEFNSEFSHRLPLY